MNSHVDDRVFRKNGVARHGDANIEPGSETSGVFMQQAAREMSVADSSDSGSTVVIQQPVGGPCKVLGGKVHFGLHADDGGSSCIVLPPKKPDEKPPTNPDGDGTTEPDEKPPTNPDGDGTTDPDGKPPESDSTEDGKGDSETNAREKYKDHVFLSMMNGGSCIALTGNVLFCFVFVNHPDEKLFWRKKRRWWSDKQIKRLNEPRGQAMSLFMQEAERDGVQLSCTVCDFTIEADVCKNRENTGEWKNILAKDEGCSDLEELIDKLKVQHQVEQVAFVFMTQLGGRSFARCAWSGGRYAEHAIIYKEKYRRVGVIVHECLHLFGAEDLYFHKTVTKMARKLFPNSFMLHARDSSEITNLTRFLIGWHKEPKPDAVEFLEATKNITQAEFDAARAKS